MQILLYGIVGDPDEGLDAASVVRAISAATDSIDVRINSLGGLVFEGYAILNALKQSPLPVTVYIDGVAGSIASAIAMVGDRIVMAESAVIMIHKPAGGGVMATAPELRASADQLDMLQQQIANVYARRTGISAEDLQPLLDAETWFTAPEALALNFVDEIVGASTATNLLDASKFGFRKVPAHPLIANATSAATAAAVLSSEEDIIMPEGTQTAAETNSAETNSTAAIGAAVAIQPVNIGDAVAVALAAERSRASTIRNEATRAGLDAAFGDSLVNEGVSIDVARTRIIDQIATSAPNITNYRPAAIPAAQFAARAEAMSVAIAHRANPTNQLTDDARGFAGRRLIVLARDFLDATGVNTRNMGDVQVAQAVFRYRQPLNAGQHTTSDFPSLMANTVGRTLRRGYELAPQTFRPFCRQSTVPDFRPVTRVALSDISPMQAVAEAAEYQYATMGDGGESYLVGKWGQIISLSWETIVNDDLNAFDRIPMAMGMEASQVESDVVWAIMLGNPNMADGLALFEANTHKNLAAAPAAIAIASLQAGRTRMRTQKSPKGRFLNNAPSYLIAGPLNEQSANQYTSANYVATKNSDVNPEYNRTLGVIIEPRVTNLDWFLSADPNKAAIDTIETATLAGHEGLQTEQRQGFEVDGVDIKARIVFGAKAIDFRGMDKTPGQ